MKRTILYYGVAVLCSTLLMGLSAGVHEYFFQNWSSGMSFSERMEAFGFFSGAGIVFGSPAAILGAFLLRRTMRYLHCRTLWHWVAGGATLALLVTWLLGSPLARLAHATELEFEWFSALLYVLSLGPGVVVQMKGLWLSLPVGGITAALLFKIDVRWAPVAGATGLGEEGERRI